MTCSKHRRGILSSTNALAMLDHTCSTFSNIASAHRYLVGLPGAPQHVPIKVLNRTPVIWDSARHCFTSRRSVIGNSLSCWNTSSVRLSEQLTRQRKRGPNHNIPSLCFNGLLYLTSRIELFVGCLVDDAHTFLSVRLFEIKYDTMPQNGELNHNITYHLRALWLSWLSRARGWFSTDDVFPNTRNNFEEAFVPCRFAHGLVFFAVFVYKAATLLSSRFAFRCWIPPSKVTSLKNYLPIFLNWMWRKIDSKCLL